MEFLRRAANPWGQEVLIGIAWDLFWASIVIGIAFVVFHALWVRLAAPAQAAAAPSDAATSNIPERIERHSPGARAFHWLMTVAMFALLITAFFPIVGIRFPWVTIHWIAGIGLIATILFHVVHVVWKQDFWSMWIDRNDVKEGSDELKGFLSRSPGTAARAGKYPVDHKLYHHGASLAAIVAIATGLLMMVRVDTPFWTRDPYLLSDQLWGVVYVMHGLSSVVLITMIIAHIYFAIRPEKRWITWSMINGTIDRDQYLAHHDPQKWVIGKDKSRAVTGMGGGTLGEGVPHDEASGS